MTYRVIEKGTREYRKLQILADMMNLDTVKGYEYKVEECYMDYGAGIMWTTICYDSEWGGVQVLSPREWESVVVYADTVEDIKKVFDEIREDRYWDDK